ncbi:MAG: hypothetical protein ACD_19C00056G0001 [uncultured bacterium]|nr:MAG: hypothetical protein ACD_19C00056G0001 [uncultured bacterium]
MINPSLAEEIVKQSNDTIESFVNDEISEVFSAKTTAERLNQKYLYNHRSGINYKEYFKNNKISSTLYNCSNIDGKLKVLFDALCYIPMSPKKEQEHKITYVVEDNSDVCDCNMIINDTDIHEINSNKDRANCVMSFWSTRAKQLAGQDVSESKFDIPNDDFKLSRFILRGKPGVGKTAFLNYIFSVNAEYLIKNNIIWIRTDLSKPRGSGLDLRTQMYAKFLRIFCVFYLGVESFPFNDVFIKELRDELVSEAKKLKTLSYRDKDPSQLAEEYIGLLGNIEDILKKREQLPVEKRGRAPEITSFYTEFSLTSQLANKFTEILMAFIQKRFRYGFILLFDGLDSVSMDYVQINIFQNWIGQLDGTTDNSSNMFKAVYVTTMRDYSFIYLYRESQSHKIRNDFKEFSIAPKSIFQVLRSRSVYASFLFKEQGLDINSNVTRNIYFNLLIILYKTLNLGEGAAIGSDIAENCFKHFNELNNDNLRAAFRFIREFICLLYNIADNNIYEKLTRKIIPDELLDKVKVKEWEIVRLLLFGDANVRLYSNRIQFKDIKTEFDIDLSKPGLIEIDNNNRAVIPNIFNYREFAYDEGQLFLKNLFKLRVIQFLMQQSGCRAGVMEIILWYKKVFCYEGNDLRFEIREMIYNGILAPECDDLSVANNEIREGNYIVNLSGLGKSILSSIIYKSIYYEIICDDTPIQRDFSYHMTPISKWDKNVSSSKYIISKTKMVLFFLIYLQRVEDAEIAKFISVDNQTLGDYEKKYRIFSKNVLDAIESDIISSIAGYLKARKDRGLSWRKQFLADWKNEFGISGSTNF